MSAKQNIFEKCGGPTKVARWCEVHPSQCFRWKYIPAKHQVTILARARAEGIDLSPDDFFDLEGETS
jgi:hypothetical protein